MLTTEIGVPNRRTAYKGIVKNLSELDKDIPKYIFGVGQPDLINWDQFFIRIDKDTVRISASLETINNMFQGENKSIEIAIKSEGFSSEEILTMYSMGQNSLLVLEDFNPHLLLDPPNPKGCGSRLNPPTTAKL